MSERLTAIQTDAILDVVDQCKLVVACDPRRGEEAPQGVKVKGLAQTPEERYESEKRVLRFLYDFALSEGVPEKQLDEVTGCFPSL